MTEETLGQEAQQIIDSEAFKTAFATLTQELTDQWQNSPARDADAREKLYQMLWISKRFRVHLESLVTSGKMAATHKKTIAERLSRSLPEWMSGSANTSPFE